jgi:hypothetical protein
MFPFYHINASAIHPRAKPVELKAVIRSAHLNLSGPEAFAAHVVLDLAWRYNVGNSRKYENNCD